MRKILLSVAAAASLLAAPVFAQSVSADRLSSDPEIRVQQEWEQLVAKVNGQTAPQLAIGTVAAVKPASATDAATAKQTAPTGRYQSAQDYWQDR